MLDPHTMAQIYSDDSTENKDRSLSFILYISIQIHIS